MSTNSALQTQSSSAVKVESAMQKQARQSADGLANAPLKKKIGFFSAMMIVVGSCVGAGIFFKAGGVLSNSANSLVLAIFSWLLASFAVIAMGLALIEIASARNDNLSIIGWAQTFNGKMTYKACKNFMVYIYLPLTYFFMPLYVIMSIQDGLMAILPQAHIDNIMPMWVLMMIIAVLMSVYFIVVCGLSSKAGNIQNWIITGFKFIPLVLAIVLGFWSFAEGGGQLGGQAAVIGGLDKPNIWFGNPAPSIDGNTTFASLTPGFGIFIAVAAIFFAYDGFYVAAGIQSEMKEPKKTPLAMLFGLILVTVIYLLIAIAMSIGGNGSPFGFQKWLDDKGLNWLYATFQILIGVGVLGIINGFALWSTRFMEDLILANEVPYSTKLAPKINGKVPYVGIVYNLVISLPIVVLFCIIGGLGYLDTVGYGADYGLGAGQLYSFADLMGTWTALLAFAFIAFIIMGGLKNRRTNDIQVQKSKYFVPMGIITVVISLIALFMTMFDPIANIFMMYGVPYPNWSDAEAVAAYNEQLIARIMLIVVLVLFLALMYAPIFIENMLGVKKYGSLDDAELGKAKEMAKIQNKSLKMYVLLSLAASKRVNLEKWEKSALNRPELNKSEIDIINGHGDYEAEFIALDKRYEPVIKAAKKRSSASKKATTVKKSTSSTTRKKATVQKM